MNMLSVTYDDDGTRHYWRDDEEITEAEYMTQHPYMKTPERKDNGRDGSSDSGNVGNGDQRIVTDDEAKAEQVRQGLRDQRAKAKAAQAE